MLYPVFIVQINNFLDIPWGLSTKYIFLYCILIFFVVFEIEERPPQRGRTGGRSIMRTFIYLFFAIKGWGNWRSKRVEEEKFILE
jgi:hypothetical protein